jgi:large subunit ribosomal protein L21
MYAVIQTAGRQYRVAEGDVITVDRIEGKPGEAVEFTQVLLLEREGRVSARPAEIRGSRVTGKIVAGARGKKIRVFRYRRRKNTMRTKGSRSKQTLVSIEKILTA